MTFFCLKMGDNNNTFIFSLPRYPKYLSPSARIWSPLELFVIHPGEGPRWEGPKLGSVWGFVFKALVLQKDGVINMKSLRSKHLQQLTARGKKKNHAAAAQPTERTQQIQQRIIPLMQIYHRIITVLLRSTDVFMWIMITVSRMNRRWISV